MFDISFLMALILVPLLQTLVLSLAGENRPVVVQSVRIGSFFLFLMGFMAVILAYNGSFSGTWLYLDKLNATIVALIAIIGGVVQLFSIQALQAEKNYRGYFCRLGILLSSLLTFVLSNHLALLFISWVIMGLGLRLLLTFKPEWQGAQASSRVAGRTFIIGDVCFAIGLACFASATQSLQLMEGLSSLTQANQQPGLLLGLSAAFIVIAALTKCANWPFQTWLIHSLTAPTPVSAVLHAGFINSGGYLLARFSPLYNLYPEILIALMAIGSITAILGSWSMMVQTDVKRYLALSTIGQMGFMMLQCGLGGFYAAISHMVIHGLLKASLFLGSGMAMAQWQYTHKSEFKESTKRLENWGLSAIIFSLLMIIGLNLPMLLKITGPASLLGLTAITLPVMQAYWHLPAEMKPSRKCLIVLPVLLVMAILYLLVNQLFHGWLAETLTPVSLTNSIAWWIPGLFIAANILFQGFANGVSLLPTSIQHRLYVWLLNRSLAGATTETLTYRRPALRFDRMPSV